MQFRPFSTPWKAGKETRRLDRLAKQQACQLFIEQEIEKGLAEGKGLRQLGREIASWIEKYFEAKVASTTIAMRASRIRKEKEGVTNVTPESTPEDDSESLPEKPTGAMGVMEREMIPRPTRQGEEKDSTPLWNLKRWWKRASMHDRSNFKKWIEKN